MVLEHRVKVSAATLAALFAADRTDHIYRPECGILAFLQRDIDVLTDRYYLSSFAYQGMSVDWAWIEEMHAFCIRPALICFVDVPVEVCLTRIAARSTREKGGQADLFENRDSLTRARESHLIAIERLRERGDRIAIVDGNASADLVHERLWRAVQPALEARQPG
jgi:dTMP kinase